MKRIITKQTKQHATKLSPSTKAIRLVDSKDLSTVIGGVMKKLNEMGM